MIVNFFESIIRIDVRMCEDQMVELVYHDSIFYRGAEESALREIKKMAQELSGMGEKDLVFNVSNKRSTNSNYEADKYNLGEKIKSFRRYSSCRIRVNTGLTGIIG